MSKKNKKSNKGQKDLHQRLQQIPAEQFVEQGKAFLEKGKARDAIDALKLAAKKNGDSAAIRQLLYRAYLLREDQLRTKGLIPEADTVKKLAFGLMPNADQLTEDDFLGYASRASVEESIKLYASFSKSHTPSVRMDQHLAYRLMMTNDWEPLDMLEISHPLCRDSASAKEAVSLMNQGNWEGALQALKAIARLSPYAPIKLFCRAMVLFYQENDSEMSQILSRIPDDFPLSECFESLKQSAGGKEASAGTSHSRFQSCLWEGPANPDKMVSEILDCFKKRQMKQAAFQISSFAKTLFPQNPVFATQQILEVVMFSFQSREYYLDDLERMIRAVLPVQNATLIIAKSEMEDSENPRQATIKYLSLLEKEIPDLNHRNMVSGMVLVNVAQRLHALKPGHRPMKNGFGLFGNPMGSSQNSNDTDKIVLELVIQSIGLDPLNRKAYELLTDLPRDSRPAKDAIETALLKMSALFPEDPFPCLELAALYYEKNAFRKAEHVLGEAAERAPHDNRVMDRRALSLVISACKNLDRGKHHLVLPDLEKAEGFNSNKIKSLIAEKKMLFDLVTNPDHIDKINFNEFDQMSSLDRIRMLGLLVQDVHPNGKPFTVSHVNALKKTLKREINKLSNLTSTDIITLLSPFPKEYKPVLPQKHIANTLLASRSDLFGSIPEADLTSTFDLLFEKDILGLMANELQLRLRKKNLVQAAPMRFFLITLGYMTGESYGSERYTDLIAKANDPVKKELETLSKKLSRHASGFLKSSLEHFDFSALEGTFPKTGIFDVPFPDFDEDDFDDMDEADDVLDMLDGISPFLDKIGSDIFKEEGIELVDHIEEMVDELHIRGMPEGEIREIRNFIRCHPPMQKMLDSMGKMMKYADPSDLSREAKILLFGKNPKKKQSRFF